ncbi:phosphoenolpyruvate--protein phosphotransferase [Gorillibacterium massiliense]|uniref:phosphoenolpyruvate--protein phosphotransferase n=1 Tax=Gorillibacterium massiliense TaxID=1280390 RepID=UPI0004BA2FF6|nr:phosphoenolpyruvate--protein phosphotransferase [Gorillibacterium massiliense]
MELRGIAASSGYAIGKARLLAESATAAVEPRLIEPDEIDGELARFEAAAQAASAELNELVRMTKMKMGEYEAEIFETHLMLLEDEEFFGGTLDKIRAEHKNAEWALQETANEIAATIESMDNEYLRERGADIRDVSRRVLNKLTGTSRQWGEEEDGPVVLLASELTPSDTATLDGEVIAGFATATGGRTSHSAIMARSLEIPAVVGLGSALDAVNDGQTVILDGVAGILYVDPDAETVARYRERMEASARQKGDLQAFLQEPSVTRDGHRVELAANIGNPKDAAGAREKGAEGVGLFRTEFLYMDRDTMPTEEEQFAAYKMAAEEFAGRPVVIRTLDIGGDKKLPYLPLPAEENPFLGRRAIRLCLDPEGRPLFKTQLRAILRASAYGNVKIMFPMIATVSEWRQATAVLEEVKEELTAQSIPFNGELETGIMIEIPAAALMADQLAKEVDFFSIGTNDLVQYTMAADRMNETLAYLNDPLYPAVLRLIHQVIRAAKKEGIWAGMCGEMAASPHAIPVLLGMGLHEFSMSASSVLPARELISRLDMAEMKKLAKEVLELDDPAAIKKHIEARVSILQQ